MRHCRAGSTEEIRKKNAKSRFFTSHSVYVKLRYYSDVVHSFVWESALEL